MKKLLVSLLVIGSFNAFAESRADLKNQIKEKDKLLQSYESQVQELKDKISDLENPNIMIKSEFNIIEIKFNKYAPEGSSVFDAELITDKNWRFGLYCRDGRHSKRHTLGLPDRPQDMDFNRYSYAQLSFEACQKIMAAHHTVSERNPVLIKILNFGDESKQTVADIIH